MSSKHKTPKRISLFVLACLLPAVFLPTGSLAQQPAKIPHIGYLTGQVLSAGRYRTEALRQGLRELGYIEGKTCSSNGAVRTEVAIASARSRPS